MKKNSIKINKCRLCNSTKLIEVLSFKPTPIGDDYTSSPIKKKKYSLVVKKCIDCHFSQLSETINPKLLYGDYLYVTKTSLGLPLHFKNLVNKLQKEKIVYSGCNAMEIGSNDSTLLKMLKNKGANVLGIDPAAKKRNNQNVETINKFFDLKLAKNIKKKYGKFDLIIANNVIANMNDLKDVFNGIDELITETGYFVMETFSLSGLIKNKLIDNIYHEHISYFSIKPLLKFAKKNGLEIFYVEHLNVKGGSLRFIFNKGQKINKHNKQIQKAINYEKKINLNKLSTFKKIQNEKNSNNKKIKEFIVSEYKKNKVICGFGASVGSTTSIYDLEIKDYLKFMLDHEKLRHGLYLPGTKLKVLNPNVKIKNKPDIVVIFAWRYAKAILKRTIFKKNTIIVLPLPKFRTFKI